MLSVFLYSSWLLIVVLYFNPKKLNKKKIPPGEALLFWIKNFNWEKRSSKSEDYPDYKYFSPLVGSLLELSRKYGGQYRESLQIIKDSLAKDLQFEKKLKEFIWGTYFQKLIIFAMSWAIILISVNLVNITLSPKIYWAILLWQILGLIILPIVTQKLRGHYFTGIGKIYLSLFTLRSLSVTGLSKSENLKLAKISELQFINHQNLRHLVEKIQVFCEKSMREGGQYFDEIEELILECKFIENWHMELFVKRMNATKLIILACFFLPSYFAFMYSILNVFISRI